MPCVPCLTNTVDWIESNRNSSCWAAWLRHFKSGNTQRPGYCQHGPDGGRNGAVACGLSILASQEKLKISCCLTEWPSEENCNLCPLQPSVRCITTGFPFFLKIHFSANQFYSVQSAQKLSEMITPMYVLRHMTPSPFDCMFGAHESISFSFNKDCMLLYTV